MQTIEITGATGTGPYDVYICDITNTYCFQIATSVPIPTVYFQLPATFTNPLPGPSTITFGPVSSLIIKIVDLSSGCETFTPYYCPSPTPTPTITQTPTSTNTNCYCHIIDNPNAISLNFEFFNCSGIITYDSIPAFTSTTRCGNSFVGEDGIIITQYLACSDGECPPLVPTQTPTPTQTMTETPTQTPTPTPTQSLEPIGKLFQMGDIFIYMDGNIYIFQNQ